MAHWLCVVVAYQGWDTAVVSFTAGPSALAAARHRSSILRERHAGEPLVPSQLHERGLPTVRVKRVGDRPVCGAGETKRRATFCEGARGAAW